MKKIIIYTLLLFLFITSVNAYDVNVTVLDNNNIILTTSGSLNLTANVGQTLTKSLTIT